MSLGKMECQGQLLDHMTHYVVPQGEVLSQCINSHGAKAINRMSLKMLMLASFRLSKKKSRSNFGGAGRLFQSVHVDGGIGVRDEIAAGGRAKICPKNAEVKPGGHL